MSEKSKHYDLKKKYYELLAANPDYPAWQDLEFLENKGMSNQCWQRLSSEPTWHKTGEYRYSPLPKKWDPKNITYIQLEASANLTEKDCKKLQSYATKLSWLREQGGHEFELNKPNYSVYNCRGKVALNSEYNDPYHDTIYMNRFQAKKWLQMLNNNEV